VADAAEAEPLREADPVALECAPDFEADPVDDAEPEPEPDAVVDADAAPVTLGCPEKRADEAEVTQLEEAAAVGV